ncbi:MAG: hypothetical protein PVI75_03620 [Gammaproteobacteria bacterium]|jgi:hypothetical protein
MNNFFDPSRFGKLLKSDLALKKSSILTVAMTIIGVLLFYNLISPYNILSVNYHPTGFIFLLFIGGIWISSRGFKYLHDKTSNYFYLTLPCSNFEKFLAKLGLTSIIYALAILILYTFFYWILAIISLIFFRHNYFIVTPFLASTWKIIWTYIVIQSIFLLGSIYFKKLPLIKTILITACIGIILFILLTSIMKIFFTGFLVSTLPWVLHLTSAHSMTIRVLHYVFWILLAPFCWVVTYFRLKEIEV